MREAQFFSVTADEPTDVASDEQLSIFVHYVDDGGPQERFLGAKQGSVVKLLLGIFLDNLQIGS